MGSTNVRTKYKYAQGDASGTSLSAVTTGTGTALDFTDCRQVNWFVIGSGTISAGTVVIECAHSATYTGTWHEIDSLDASTITGNAGYGGTFPMVPGGFLRARVSVTIAGGGNITVVLNGLQN